MITLHFDGSGPAPTNELEQNRTEVQANFAALQTIIPLPPEAWTAVGQLIEQGYLLGIRERMATEKANLSETVQEIARRLP